MPSLDELYMILAMENVVNNKKQKPKFGDRVRGIYASESNPQRDGYFVEELRHKVGPYSYENTYRITDGNGNFWEYPPESTILINEIVLEEEEFSEGDEHCWCIPAYNPDCPVHCSNLASRGKHPIGGHNLK